LPFNFDNNHWCMIIVDLMDKVMHLFDPLQSEMYYKRLEKICGDYLSRVIPDYENSFSFDRRVELTQTDGHNCGTMVVLCAMMTIKSITIPAINHDTLQSLRFTLFTQCVRAIHPSSHFS
ncbi:hypothetical protein F443_07212, partial [Phytophthora nicotianae P1569]